MSRESNLYYNPCSPRSNDRDRLFCHRYFDDVTVIYMFGLSSHIRMNNPKADIILEREELSQDKRKVVT